MTNSFLKKIERELIFKSIFLFFENNKYLTRSPSLGLSSLYIKIHIYTQ